MDDMDINNMSNNTEERKQLVWALLIGAVLILTLVSASLGYQYILSISEDISGETINTKGTPYNYGLLVGEEKIPNPTGDIYLTLQGTNDIDLRAYTVNVAGLNSEVKRVHSYRASSVGIEFLDPHDPTRFYLNMIAIEDVGSLDPTKIHYMSLTQGWGNATVDPIQKIDAYGERSIAYSPVTKKVAYSRMSEKPSDEEYVKSFDNWEVVVYDENTDTEEIIVQGASYPDWSPDGSNLLYLRSDGLYRYSIKTGSEEKMWKLASDGDGSISNSVMIGLSPNGKYLAWTFPNFDLIALYEIDWRNFSMKEIGRIQNHGTQYYWPVFSPNNEFYVVQAIDEVVGNDERVNPRLEIRSVLNRRVVRSYSLKGFDFMKAFTDDWIY